MSSSAAAAAVVLMLLLATGVECQRQNNAPEWLVTLQEELQDMGLDENTQPGTVIGTLRATDVDGDRVFYSTSFTDFFSVNRDTGEVRLEQPLDRELLTQVEVTFFAEDGKGNKVPVTYPITITDVNDNAPQFEGVPYYTRISEFAGRGTVVKSDIRVTDRDAADNARISLSCHAEEGNQEAAEACAIFSVAGQQVRQGEYQGFVTLDGELDYETKRSYTITIRATDAGDPRQSTLVNLVVDVSDAQDQGPVFTNAPFTAVLLENTGIGQVVGSLKARDRDAGNPNPIRISMVEDSYNLLELGPTRADINGIYTAEIRVRASIDREAIQDGSYIFQATATEVQSGVAQEDAPSTQTVVVVNIQDVNDNPPVFDQAQYSVTVDEGTTGPLFIRDLIVRDRDEGSNAAFRVEIVDSTFLTFDLSPTTGRNTAALSLIAQRPEFMDYEEPQYRMQVVKIRATETETAEQRSSTATVTVYLSDVNDNAPTFQQTSYQFTVSELMRAGDTVGTVMAEDPDKEGKDVIEYGLSGEFSESFEITPTGEIRLVAPVDYELTGDSLELQIEASDAGGRSSVALVRIGVSNHNDEAPEFQIQEYETSVDETSTELKPPITVRAIDRDSTNIVYTILAGNTADNAFSLGATTGELRLNRPLQYKDTPQGLYTLVIQARDDGSPAQSGTATITVTVKDINDNAPMFQPQIYASRISELAKENAEVVQVFARDEDTGAAGQIEFQIGTSQDNFYIEANTGMIKVKQGAVLDLETSAASYILQVLAVDKGSPPQTGTTQVTVIVEDDNNHAPEFPVDLYKVTLSEDVEVGDSVLQLEALDPDSTADLRYSIRQATLGAQDRNGQPITDLAQISRMFVLEDRTGVIRTQSELDRDTAAQVSFTVEVRDVQAVDPPPVQQSATVSVIMNIRSTSGDIDFERPSAGRSDELSLTVREDPGANTPIGAIVAHNPVTGQVITNYVKVPGSDPAGYFNVNNRAGTISLARDLDYEEGQRTLSMRVQAFTNDSPPRSADITITVQVLDVNDNRPEFAQQNYEFRISEGLRYPGQFGIVVATDADSGRYGTIRYGINGPAADIFDIDPVRGYLSLKEGVILDTETTSFYDLIITATDNPPDPNLPQSLQQSTTTTARVQILDENDNPPVFSREEYPLSVLQDSPVGTELGRVRATDRDQGANGRVRYSIMDDSTGGLFGVDPESGAVFTRRDLTSVADVLYRLTVSAQDGGYPVLSARATLSILVQSPHGYDGKPRFLFPQQDGATVTIPETVGFGGNVTRVIVQGPQDGSKWMFRFLTTGTDYQTFRIDPVTGIITVRTPLDRETKQQYELIVEVSDRTDPSLEPGVRRFTVALSDRDDNEPRIVGCANSGNRRIWEVYMDEGEAVGIKVPGLSDLQGCDADAPPNNRMYYFITCGNEPDRAGVAPFFIDKASGVITTQISLDRETRSEYELCVTVNKDPKFDMRFKEIPSDDALRQDDTTVKVIVFVTDKNDNVANFAAQTNGNEMIAAITSSSPFHTEVYRVYMVDADSTVGQVEYQLQSQHFNLGLRDSRSMPGAFSIDKQGGSIYTNLPTYRDYEGGRFILKVAALNAQKAVEDQMELTVYIVRDDEQYKYVFDEGPAQVKATEQDFLRAIINTLGDPQIQIYPTTYYHSVFPNKTVNLRRTELCFHIVDHREQELVGKDDAFNLLSLSRSDLQDIYTQYKVTGLDMCSSPYTTKTWSDQYWAWWLLIALAILLFILALLLIICIASLWDKYRNRLTRYKPYVVLDPYELPYKQEYEWQETTVKMG